MSAISSEITSTLSLYSIHYWYTVKQKGTHISEYNPKVQYKRINYVMFLLLHKFRCTK